jgi:hypothetical protein
LLCFAQSAALPTPSGEWYTAPTIIAASITSLLTIAGIVLKDIVIKWFEERRKNNKEQSEIYERYSHPLAAATISLQNRLYEILHQKHRPVYLLGCGLPESSNQGSEYRSYKKLSTIYRLAAMLGWIRACRREFSYLRVGEQKAVKSIHKAIDDFENALADGNHLERQRIQRLYELWHLGNPGNNSIIPELDSLATQVDNLICDCLEKWKVEDLSLLNEALRRELSKNVADCLCSHLHTNKIADQSLERTWPDAFAILAIRQAWIYRDWQSAIGDIMIMKSEHGPRMFEVIGYGSFEELYSSKDQKHQKDMRRLFAIFDELDLSIEDRFDARPDQLRTVAKATAKLILAIDKTQASRSIVPEYPQKIARQILEHEL